MDGTDSAMQDNPFLSNLVLKDEMSRMKAVLLAMAFALSGTNSANASEIVSTEKTYDERLRSREVTKLGDDLFGDSVSLKDGSLSFSQKDVSIDTASGLKVEFVRRTPRQKQGLDRSNMPLGAGWEIDIPYMMGTYDNRRGWDTAYSGNSRCTASSLRPSEKVGPSPNYNTRVIPSKMYWSGVFINIPGAGYESLLKIRSDAIAPSDGNNYIGTTASHWRVGCMTKLKNGVGEGFFVVTPDGTKIYFDWMAERNAADVLESEYDRDDNGDGKQTATLLVPTSDYFLYASRVEDRFGNWVTYEFDSATVHSLKAIVSSDGARIDVVYGGDGKIAEVKAAGRTWKYSYVDSYYGKKLSEVLLPDGSNWSFPTGTANHYGAMWWYMVPPSLPTAFYMNACGQSAVGFRQQDTPNERDVTPVTMKHPSGAVGEFVLRSLVHGSDKTPGGCDVIGTSSQNFGFGSYGVPDAYIAKSLISKRISGPGLASKEWSYAYSPHWSFNSDCGSSCTSSTIESRPDGVKVEYVFGNSYTDNLGELISRTQSKDGIIFDKVEYERASYSGQYPESAGDLIAEGNPFTTKLRPLRSTRTMQNGRVFQKRVEAFDSFARPLRETRSSTPLE